MRALIKNKNAIILSCGLIRYILFLSIFRIPYQSHIQLLLYTFLFFFIFYLNKINLIYSVVISIMALFFYYFISLSIYWDNGNVLNYLFVSSIFIYILIQIFNLISKSFSIHTKHLIFVLTIYFLIFFFYCKLSGYPIRSSDYNYPKQRVIVLCIAELWTFIPSILFSFYLRAK